MKDNTSKESLMIMIARVSFKNICILKFLVYLHHKFPVSSSYGFGMLFIGKNKTGVLAT